MEQDPSLLEEETVIKEHTRKKMATHEERFKGLKVEKVVVYSDRWRLFRKIPSLVILSFEGNSIYQ